MSIEALSLNDDLLIRRLEALAPVQPLSPTCTGISPLSSIDEVAPISDSSSSRPELEPPKKHYLYGLIRAHQETERLAGKQADLFEKQIDHDLAEIERLNKEKEKALEKYAEEVRSRDTWGAWATVGQYLVSGATLVMGFSCYGIAARASYFLITSGLAGLTNQILRDTGGWSAIAGWFQKSEETQKKLASQLEMGAFLLSFGLGLIGGLWARHAGAIAAAERAVSAETIRTKVGQIISTVGGILGTGARVQEALANKKIAHLQARMKIIDLEATQKHQDLYQSSSEAKKWVETTADLAEEVKRAISSSMVN